MNINKEKVRHFIEDINFISGVSILFFVILFFSFLLVSLCTYDLGRASVFDKQKMDELIMIEQLENRLDELELRQIQEKFHIQEIESYD